MKKLLNIFIVFLLGFVIFGAKSEVYAQTSCPSVLSGLPAALPRWSEGMTHTIVFDFTGMQRSGDYYIKIKRASTDLTDFFQSSQFTIPSNTTDSNRYGTWTIQGYIVTLTLRANQDWWSGPFANNAFSNEKHVFIYKGGTAGSNRLCEAGMYTTAESVFEETVCNFAVGQNRKNAEGNPAICYDNPTEPNSCTAKDISTTIKVSGLKGLDGQPYSGNVYFGLGADGSDIVVNQSGIKASGGIASIKFTPETSSEHTITVYGYKSNNGTTNREKFPGCEYSFVTQDSCTNDQCSATPLEEIGLSETEAVKFSLCKQIPDSPEFEAQRTACFECTGGGLENEGNQGVWTAVGCIKRDAQSIIRSFITIGLGMAGGFTLLTFLASGFIFSTSAGDPKAYGKAKEMMTSAIVGILFIIFSVTILQFIGYEILKIPGFGG